ncbi:universal stress protein [Thermodesulfobacterium hydrogeniphilum]|uniref:universal stress protein n=1 Tax=Thermodesulfobacterium hydrogeniphilum TaxID=161156 RepID=UPI00056FDC46|nr:universal stress protein [Thermodesulfobacterium hydrogeniphilum]
MKIDSKINPHFLLCYDNSASSAKALFYLKSVFENTYVDVTLLKIIEHPEIHVLQESKLIKKLIHEEEIEKRAKEDYLRTEAELKEVAESLKAKIKGNCYIKVIFKYSDVVQDILRIACDNLYDAIIVGKRGLSKISTYILGGVTHKLINISCVPVWLIRGEKWNKKFLVALDLGETGLKVADYVSFILSFHKDATITFFHNFYPFSNIKEFEGNIEELLKITKNPEYKEYFLKLKNVLKENKIFCERIQLVLKRGIFGPAGEIIRFAKKNDYSNIIIGRRGRSGLKELLLGSVSQKIISYFEDRAIWVIS